MERGERPRWARALFFLHHSLPSPLTCRYPRTSRLLFIQPAIMYHYHLNREFPYSVGCFRGSVDYYSALGSDDMRETMLPLYSRSAAAAKLRNVRAELQGATGEEVNATAKGVVLGGALTAAAARVEAVEALKWNGTA